MKELVTGERSERTKETGCQLATWDVGYIVRGSGEEGGSGERRLGCFRWWNSFRSLPGFPEKVKFFVMGTDR